jgi:hypothetical protein
MVLARHKSGYGSLTFRNCTSRSTGLILGQAITSNFRAAVPQIRDRFANRVQFRKTTRPQIRDRPTNRAQFRKPNRFLGI